MTLRSRWASRIERFPQDGPGQLLDRLILAILVGVPLLILPGVSFHFDITPKVIVLLCGTGVAVLFWRGYGPGLEAALTGSMVRWFVALIGTQALSLIVSTVFSTQTPLSFAGTNWRRLGLVPHLGLLMFTLVLLGWLVADRHRYVLLLRAVSVAGGLTAVYGIAQYFGIDPLLPASAYGAPMGGSSIVRPPGTLGHAGYFATYLLYALFLAGALVRSDSSRWWRVIGVVAVALCAIAIVLTGTRSALLGLAVGGVVLLLWYRSRPRWRALSITAATAIAAVVFYVSPAGDQIRTRIAWAEEDVGGGGRLWLWGDSARMALDFWPVGAGLETFANVFPRYQSVALAQAYPDSYYESPHNVLLDAATAQGLLGLAVLLGLVAVPLVAAKRGGITARRAASGEDAPVGLLVASFVAGLVSQQFLVFTVPTALAFYTGAVLLVAWTVVPNASRVPVAYRRIARVGVLGVSVLLLTFGGQLVLADRALQWARLRVEERNVLGTLQAYEQVRRVQPWGMNTDIWFTQAMDLLANNAPDIAGRIAAMQVVMEASQRAAVRSDQRPNALYGVAASLAASGNYPAAENAAREAIRSAPHWYKPHLLLARVLSEQGLLDRVRQEAELAVWLNGGKNPEVRKALEALEVAR